MSTKLTPEQQVEKQRDEAQKTALQEAKQDLETRQKLELEELQRRHQREQTAIDPTARPVDADALDATKPRGPEAPYETMKPSQRQGQGIETLPAPPILEKPHDATSEVVPETVVPETASATQTK